jgi:predicted DNA-binding protein with PD1-like motif
MKTKTLVASFAVLVAAAAFAAETRIEIVKPAANDALPNNPAVPDVYALDGKIERIVVLRFKFDTDLLAGLERLVKEQRIKNAVILSGIGSVRGYHIHQVSNRTLPSKNIFVKDPEAPADIAGMNGYVFDGAVHAHITLANPDRAFGGHLEPGTTVFTFAIVTLGVLPDSMDLKRADDKNYR